MKTALQWRSEYEVGVKEIDDQHREFLRIANEIIDLSGNEPIDAERAKMAIGRLGDYALYHLGTEEEYFLRCKYAGAEEHTEAHDGFRQAFKKLSGEIFEKGPDVAKAVNEAAAFAGEWLVGHILTMDHKYIETFKRCGLK